MVEVSMYIVIIRMLENEVLFRNKSLNSIETKEVTP
nr:MAG TPA: hypothetical protein [Caudoviricetes sp.]